MSAWIVQSDGVSSPEWTSLGRRLRVAYQGEPGAYSESAAIEYFGEDVCAVPCESFERVFEAVERGGADRAVLPIENSLAGTIHRNYDLLLQHSLQIVGEVDLRVQHYLLALEGVTLEDVRVVQSHPMALAQCDKFLTEHDLAREVAADTAGSARLLRDGGYRDRAAIAGARAAKIYALQVLAEGIEDEPDNYTRFLVLAASRGAPPPAGVPAKTSIAFSLENSPGVLFKALSVFALRDIDLTKIESRHLRTLRYLQASTPRGDREEWTRPDVGAAEALDAFITRSGGGQHRVGGSGGHWDVAEGWTEDRKRWDYLFYLDIAASVAEVKTKNALNHLSEIATFIRVLGSYRQYVSADERD